MNDIRERLIYLHHLQSLTRTMLRKIIIDDVEIRKFFSYSISQISELLATSIEKSTAIYNELHDPATNEKVIKTKQTCRIVTILDKNYPHTLKTIYDPPFVLYMLGNQRFLNHRPSLSVIGTRKPSKEAFPKLNLIIVPLIKQGWTIVSGLALGIDSFSHTTTLQYGGKTIGVLGGGFHHLYPKQNEQLFHDMTKRGLVISEYPPHIRPRRYHFPERNRIISGLTHGTLVIEARIKSGTLITVDQALEQGREVYAVPGSPLLPHTEGCHKLIQDGAKLVVSADDILEEWNMSSFDYKSHLLKS